MTTQLQYFANLGIGTVSVANSNLDGTGTLVQILSGANDGTLIKSATIVATASTSQGMVRLFVGSLNNFFLVREINIPATTQTGIERAFQTTVDVNYTLESGDRIYASTEKAETFNIFLDSVNMVNCACV